MEDQEIKELIQDLESVGLSDNLSIIEIGKDGVEEIQDERDSVYNRIYLLKTAGYSSIKEFDEVYSGKPRIILRHSTDAWFIEIDKKENMRKVSEKIQRFINS